MKRLLLPLLLVLALPTSVNAFWGLSEEEKTICRDRASRERNEFSAKQTYKYCSKNIKSELKEKEIYKKKYDRWYKDIGQYGCRLKEEAVKKCDSEILYKCKKWHKENPSKPKSDDQFEINICPYAFGCSDEERSLRKCKERLRESKKEYGL